MMRSRTILLCWELGAGFGYALRLRKIAREIAGAGYRPVLALRSIVYAQELSAELPVPVLQAPWVIGHLPGWRRRAFVPNGEADPMGVNGQGQTGHVYAMLLGWRDLIGLVNSDPAVASHAPHYMLAAFGRVPVVLFRSAYGMPPADGERFPLVEANRVIGDN